MSLDIIEIGLLTLVITITLTTVMIRDLRHASIVLAMHGASLACLAYAEGSLGTAFAFLIGPTTLVPMIMYSGLKKLPTIECEGPTAKSIAILPPIFVVCYLAGSLSKLSSASITALLLLALGVYAFTVKVNLVKMTIGLVILIDALHFEAMRISHLGLMAEVASALVLALTVALIVRSLHLILRIKGGIDSRGLRELKW